jgi:uncharacterized membrane protein YfcA
MEIAIGLLIGVAIGATGVGGGTLTAPALVLLMGYPPKVAVATALIFSAVVKIWASGEYLVRGQVNFRVLAWLLCGGLPGALLGAVMLEKLNVARANEWILIGIGAVVLVSAVSSIFNLRRGPRNESSRLHLLPLFTVPIGMESGFSSSGTGALGTVLLFRFTSLSPTAVVGTDLVFGMLVCGIAGVVHAASGTCDWHALSRLIPAGIAGSMIGVRICSALPTRTLRRSVLLGAAAIGLSLLVKGMEGIL